MEDIFKKAVEVFRQGGIVIYPTDTAIGIGCRIDNEESIGRLYRIKKRPKDKASPILVSDREMAQEYLLPIGKEVIEKLIKPYWPGGLTIVYLCHINKIAKPIRAGGDSLGVRIPNRVSLREIIKDLGVPILGPSANFSGDKTPFSARELNQTLLKQVDYVIPGESTLREPSTVIDCTQKPWKIIREGAVTIKL